ncbi:MAG TPA: alginate export family protein [Gemmatimonadaceae bacterium]
MDALKYVRLGSNDARYLTIGGEAREWYEGFHNALWGIGPQDDNGYLLQRLTAYGDLHLSRRVRFFPQLTSDIEAGRNGGPRPYIDESKLWFEQAFADITLARDTNAKATSLVLRLGRQEFHFGSGLLVDIREGPNVHQAFDGLALLWKRAPWDVHTFATKPVANGTGFFDAPPDSATTFWGTYAVRSRPKSERGIDVYYLGLDRNPARYDRGVGAETRHTIGTRFWGKPAAWDFNAQADFQLGTFAGGKLRAWGFYSNLGHTFRSARFKPRVAVTVAGTSGDDGDPGSPLGTFNPLFPTGFYFGQGVVSLNGPSNLMQLQSRIWLQLTKSVSVHLENHNFWRTSLDDGVYGLATNPLVSGIGNRNRYVGSQPSVGVYWQVDRHLAVFAVYDHFFAGAFLAAALPPRRSVDYTAARVVYKF